MSNHLATRTVLLAAASLLAASGLSHGAVLQLPMGKQIDAAGVPTACTGASIGARDEPRWRNYSVKFETVGGYGQYLGDELLTVRELKGGTFVRVSCESPWILMQLSPGRYAATMEILDAPTRHVRFSVPEHGQRDVIVRFPSRMAGKPVAHHLAANDRAHKAL